MTLESNSSTNRIYVANGGSNTVSVIDGATNTVLSTISVGSYPVGVGVNSSTNRIYVSKRPSGPVSVIDGATNTVLSTISVGSNPYGVGVNSSTNRIYVANTDSNTVSVIEDSSSSPPTVTTSSATDVTSSSATLNGTVNANGLSTTAWFNYGIASGSYTGTSTTQSVSGSSDTSVSIYVSGLSSGTGYYYRLVAQNNAGVSYGSEKSFTTITSSTPVPTPTPTTAIISDDFNDNSIDSSLWASWQGGSGQTITETNQRLEIYFPANSADDPNESSFSAGYMSVCTLRGDFDIQVDYELLNWPNSNGVRVYLLVESGADADKSVGRVSFGDSYNDFYGYNREVYLTDFDGEVQGFISTSDTSGKLRLVRSGSTITGYYYSSNNWVTIHSSSATTDDVNFYLVAWSDNDDFTDQDVKVAFDNFTVNQGQLICPETSTTPTPVASPSPAPTLPPLPTPQVSPSPIQEGIVFGFVIDEDDNPLKGVTVTITGNNSSDSTETDDDGYYEFSGLGAGEYAITYEKEGFLAQTQDMSLEEGEVKDLGTVTMEQVEKGKISGYVVNIKGDPIESVRLKLKGIKTKVIKTASSDADGFFEFTDLEADTYVIIAKKKKYRNARQKVVLEEGESTEIEIVMKKTSKRIRGLLMTEGVE